MKVRISLSLIDHHACAQRVCVCVYACVQAHMQCVCECLCDSLWEVGIGCASQYAVTVCQCARACVYILVHVCAYMRCTLVSFNS